MAASTTRSKPSTNGGGPSSSPVEMAKHAGTAATTAARQVRGPALAAAAGIAGGLAIGTRIGSKRRGLLARRPRVLGVPIGPKPGALRMAEALRDGAKHLGSAADQVSNSPGEVRQIREQLEQGNRRSPIEVVLDGLTHRRGAHRKEQ